MKALVLGLLTFGLVSLAHADLKPVKGDDGKSILFYEEFKDTKTSKGWHHVWHLKVNPKLGQVVHITHVTCNGNELPDGEKDFAPLDLDNTDATFEFDDNTQGEADWGYGYDLDLDGRVK
jgi:hypothetical protein